MVQMGRQVERTGVGLLGHGKQHGGVSPFAGHAQFGRLAAHAYVGHIGKGDNALTALLHRTGLELVDIIGRGDAAYDVLVAVLVAHAAVGIGVHAAGAGHHVGEAYAEVLHLAGVDEYLVLLDVATVDAHLGHATGREQPWADDPVGIGAQVLHGGLVAGKAHDEHFAQDRRLRAQHGSAHTGRHLLANGRELLAHDLARQVDVGAPVKLYPDDREAVGRLRAHAAHAGAAVDRRLDREGHQLFDFLAGHAASFGHDDHCGSVEVGEDVDLGLGGRIEAGDNQQYSQDQY